MTSRTQDREVLTVEEVAQLLRVGRNLTYQLVRDGHIACVRIGRNIRITRAALDDFMGLHSHPASSEDAAQPDGASQVAIPIDQVKSRHGQG